MGYPTLQSVKALDGRIFAMLNSDEIAVYKFYRDRGRKYGVSISVINKADPAKLAQARTTEQAEEIMKSANSILSVTFSQDVVEPRQK